MTWPTSPDVDVRYAPHLQARLDVYKQATTDTGGNVGLIYFHGGGWSSGYRRLVSATGDLGFDFASYVMTTGLTGKRWNVVSVDYRMNSYDNGVKMSYPSQIFEGIDDCARAVQWVKDNARLYGTNPATNAASYGINPNKIVFFGASAGVTNAMLVAFKRSRFFNAGAPWQTRRFEHRSSSLPALVINYMGVIDVRYDAALAVETFLFTAFPAMFGTSIVDAGVEWNALTPDIKAAASPLAYLEKATMEARPAGVYSIYKATGAGSKPYANIHAEQQAAILDAALLSKGIARTTEIVAPTTWTDYTPTPAASPSYALSARVVSFCESRL